MTLTTTVLQVSLMSCFGRHEAHCGDSVGYSHVSRTDALQSLLSDHSHTSEAHHPHDWPESDNPIHAKHAALRGVW